MKTSTGFTPAAITRITCHHLSAAVATHLHTSTLQAHPTHEGLLLSSSVAELQLRMEERQLAQQGIESRSIEGIA